MANDQQQGHGVEIVPAEIGGGGTTLVRIPDDPMAVLEARDRLMGRLVNYAIAATHPGQWQMLGDKPWPTGAACEAMARRCAVSWDKPECERRDTSDEAGPAYSWTYRTRFYLPGGRDSIWAEGHCSSRDQFLGTGLDYETRELPEVEEGNIRQAAMTNMVVNGVTRILGVRNLSKARLDALLGEGASEKMGKVAYEHGAKGGGRGKLDDEKPIPFGHSKGKKVAEAPDEDLAWLLGKMKEPASDPKYQASNDKWAKAIEAELARRASAKAGGTPPASAGAAPSVWERILALPELKGVGEGDRNAIVRKATEKGNAKDLVEADVAKVQAAAAAWRKETGHDEDFKY
jgi:hypothetical protein